VTAVGGQSTTLALAPTAVAPEQARAAVAPLLEGLHQELRFRARLLLSELVANSVRHAQLAPGQRIRVAASATADRLRVVVEDDGRGFDLAAAAPPADAPHGRGLGLLDALSHRWGASQEGCTRVWFELALDEQPDELAAAAASAASAARLRRVRAVDGAGRALRVLIADDYRLFADSLAGALSINGDVDVVGIAADGEQAVDLARALVPDLALLDLRMPVATGVEAAHRIRALGAPVTIVVMSALDDDKLVQAALAAGAVAFVSKNDLARDPLGTVLAAAAAPVPLHT
jgi:CheY-like chemotaxis protein/anti-sigma regulatory factor (Ser/Thr protein kinase)